MRSRAAGSRLQVGDTADTDGEPVDDQVGDPRSGRLVIADAEYDEYR